MQNDKKNKKKDERVKKNDAEDKEHFSTYIYIC